MKYDLNRLEALKEKLAREGAAVSKLSVTIPPLRQRRAELKEAIQTVYDAWTSHVAEAEALEQEAPERPASLARLMDESAALEIELTDLEQQLAERQTARTELATLLDACLKFLENAR